MYTKLQRTKVFRDPLYGYIEVDYKIISDLIDSKEVQRLRRIRQLSGVAMVFQTAEHTRFPHSLGAYMMARLVCHNVEGMENISEYEKLLFQIAALLHDIGHGPYSHAFESVLHIFHETMTSKIILSSQSEVNQILSSYNENIAEDIANIISHKGKYPLIEQLVSSSLDVDRLDFLQRDAYFTGAIYGRVDYIRILRSMKIVDKKLLIRASGVNSIESYIMARYHMYFQVYYHPVARSYEYLLENIFNRIIDLKEEGKSLTNANYFFNVLKNNDDILSYIELDDAYVNGLVKQFCKSKDAILNRLANSFIHRNLYECIDLSNEPSKDLIESIKKSFTEEERKYYFVESKISGAAYFENKDSVINDIKILLPDGKIKSLEDYSPIVKGLITSSVRTVERIHYLVKWNQK